MFPIYLPDGTEIDIDSQAGQAEIGRQHIEWLRRTGPIPPAEYQAIAGRPIKNPPSKAHKEGGETYSYPKERTRISKEYIR